MDSKMGKLGTNHAEAPGVSKSEDEHGRISPGQLRRLDAIMTRVLEDRLGSAKFYSGEHGNFAPAYLEDVAYVLQYLKLEPDQKITDFGSGDGRWLYIASMLELRAEGYELDPEVYQSALEIEAELIKNGVLSEESASRIKMVNADLFSSAISRSALILYYQGSGVNTSLIEAKILNEALPGTKVVVYGYVPSSPIFGNLTLIDTLEGRFANKIIKIFEVPEKTGRP